MRELTGADKLPFMLGAALLAAVAAAKFTPPRLFGDWYAGCDNGHDCTAVALRPENADDSPPLLWFALAVDRPSTRAATISIDTINRDDPDKIPKLNLSLLIDGKSSGVSFDDRGVAHQVAPQVVQSLPKAHALTLVDKAGKVIGRVSTSGASAALGWLARVQSTPAPPLPRIVTPPRSAAAPRKPTPAQVKRILKEHDCPGYDEKPQFVRLDSATSLALLPCSDEGDGTSSVAVLVSNSGAVRAPQFEQAYKSNEDSGDPNDLGGASFDMKNLVLEESFGGPAMGDCGQSRAYAWDGRTFRLAAQEIMEECRGSYAMVPLWRTANLPDGVPSQ